MWQFFTWLLGQAFASLDNRLTEIINNQTKILQSLQDQKEFIMSWKEDMDAAMATLTAQVQADTDVENSAIVLIQGIAAQLAAAAGNPAQVKALAEQLKVSTDALAAAVAANTPAAPPPEEPPL